MSSSKPYSSSLLGLRASTLAFLDVFVSVHGVDLALRHEFRNALVVRSQKQVERGIGVGLSTMPAVLADE